MMKHKRAVSPLIATVLLIAFAVALGAVVMNWGKAQLSTEEAGDESGACNSVDLLIENVNGVPKICYSKEKENTVQFLAMNKGKGEISKLKVTVISQNGDPANEVINEPLMPSDTKKFEYDYPADFGKLQKVRITPIVVASSEDSVAEDVCTTKIVEAVQINDC